MRVRGPSICLVLLVALTACAAPPPVVQGDRSASQAVPPPQRTLITAVRVEPVSLASRPLQDSGQTVRFTTRIFNAELDLVDARGVAHAYLAESLPTTNTSSWRVFSDGRMETTYRLKPNLTWHDGAALTAEDFVFASQVYRKPELMPARSRVLALMEEVLAADPLTIVIRWQGLYPDADMLQDDFQALPRHILEPLLRQDALDAFVANPFWSTEYVGLGPYRLERWEPGALIEGAAFGGHVSGRPKIDRVVVRFRAFV